MLSLILFFLIPTNSYANYDSLSILIQGAAEQDLVDQGIIPIPSTFIRITDSLYTISIPGDYVVLSEISGHQHALTAQPIQYSCSSSVNVANTAGIINYVIYSFVSQYTVVSTECTVYREKSYRNYPYLTQLINVITESSSDEGFMFFIEEFPRDQNWPCRANIQKSSEQVLRDFQQIIGDIDSSEQSNSLKASALYEFQELIGENNYAYCYSSNEDYTTYLYIGETYQFAIRVPAE